MNAIKMHAFSLMLTVVNIQISYSNDFAGIYFKTVFVNSTSSPNTTMNLRIMNPADTEANVKVYRNNNVVETLVNVSSQGSISISNPQEVGDYVIISSTSVYLIQEVKQLPGDIVDASYFIPRENLGKEYYVIGFCRYDSTCRITIVGYYMDTNITVNLKVNPQLPVYNNDGEEVSEGSFSLLLKSNQTITFESEGDLSGTYIKGNRIFSVFYSTLVNRISTFRSQNGLSVQGATRQMFPVQTLGYRYILPRSMSQYGGLIKIIATTEETEVDILSLDPFVLKKPGDLVIKSITNIHGVVIDARYPILVAVVDLHIVDNVVCPAFPSVMLVPSVEQWKGNNTVIIPSWVSESVRFYLLLHDGDKQSTKIDGTFREPEAFINVPSTSYVETDIITQPKRNFRQNITSFPGVTKEYEDDSFYLSNAYKFWKSFGFVSRYGLRFPFNHGLNTLNQPCVPSDIAMSDHIDNDCDRYIDEDVPGFACTDCKYITAGNTTNTGKEFYVTFIYYPWINYTTNVSIIMTPATELQAEVVVLCYILQDWNTSFILYPGETKQLSTTRKKFSVALPTTHISRAIVRIVSSTNIVVIGQYIPSSRAVSAFNVYPLHALGTDHYVIIPNKTITYQCVIVPVNGPDTRINIVFSTIDDLSVFYSGNNVKYRNGEQMRFSIRYYRAVQVVGNVDLTGTRIRANRPIAVFCGGMTFGRGIVVEQILPTKFWGQNYITPSFSRNTDPKIHYLKIVSRASSNVVTVKSSGNSVSCSYDYEMTFAYPGSYRSMSFEISNQCNLNITGRKPIQVMFSSIFGDLYSMLLPSIRHFVSETFLVIPQLPLEGEKRFYMGYVLNVEPSMSSINTTNLQLDGSIRLGTKNFIQETSTGIHNLTTDKFIMPFVLFQGNDSTSGSQTSYTFVAGRLLHAIVQECVPSKEIQDSKDNDCDGLVDEKTCNNASIFSHSANLMFEEDCHTQLLTPTTTQELTTSLLTSTVIADDTTTSTSVAQTTNSDTTRSEATLFRNSRTETMTNALTSQQKISSDVSRTTTQTASTLLTETTESRQSSTATADTFRTTGDQTTDGSACSCKCNSDILNTEEKLRKRLKELERALHLDKRKLSSSIRKLNSASDDRTSVRYLGFSGIFVLVLTVSFVIILDIINLAQTIKTRCLVRRM